MLHESAFEAPITATVHVETTLQDLSAAFFSLEWVVRASIRGIIGDEGRIIGDESRIIGDEARIIAFERHFIAHEGDIEPHA